MYGYFTWSVSQCRQRGKLQPKWTLPTKKSGELLAPLCTGLASSLTSTRDFELWTSLPQRLLCCALRGGGGLTCEHCAASEVGRRVAYCSGLCVLLHGQLQDASRLGQFCMHSLSSEYRAWLHEFVLQRSSPSRLVQYRHPWRHRDFGLSPGDAGTRARNGRRGAHGRFRLSIVYRRQCVGW